MKSSQLAHDMDERSQQLGHSWQVNASSWTNAVRSGAIASRRLATNAAILQAVRERKPRRVLDVGCGEGWLVRELAATDMLNFALFEENPAPLLIVLRGMLAPGGVLVIQTLHPWSDAGRASYKDGWRMETFDGFEGFTEPMPWYFRTLASWLTLISASGYRLERLSEPAHPESHDPLSLLLIAAPVA